MHSCYKAYKAITININITCCIGLQTPPRSPGCKQTTDHFLPGSPLPAPLLITMQQQPAAAQQLTVIPYPADVEFVGPGTYTLPKPPAISSSAALAPQAEFLQQGLQQRFSTPSNLQQQPEGSAQASQASIRLELVDDLPALWPYRFSNEGYELVCAEDGISIRALSTTGVFYGIQTLLQALAEGQQGLSMPHTRVSGAGSNVVGWSVVWIIQPLCAAAASCWQYAPAGSMQALTQALRCLQCSSRVCHTAALAVHLLA